MSPVAVPGHLTLSCARPHSAAPAAAGSLSLSRPPLRENRDYQASTLEITKDPKRQSGRGASSEGPPTPLWNNELQDIVPMMSRTWRDRATSPRDYLPVDRTP